MKFLRGERCNATLGGVCYIHLTKEANNVNILTKPMVFVNKYTQNIALQVMILMLLY